MTDASEIPTLILTHLEAASGPVAPEHLALALDVPRRTLQRHLASLVATRAVEAVGAGRSRRYRLGGRSTGIEAEIEALSVEGQQIQRLVRQPTALRDPVGYRREFLEDYRPNVTEWLPRSLREHLHALGRSPHGDQPAGTFARQLLDRLLIDLSWASSRLEGNTYTRLDTQNLLEFGRFAEGRDAREAQMILNHKAAIELLVDEAEGIGFNRYTFQNLHALLSDGLLADPAAGGRLRRMPVGISGSVFEPTAIPQVIQECFDLLLLKTEAISDPFEQSFFVMVQLPYLQPFEDVNKRVSRLGANIPLVKQNLVPLSFVDVPQRTYVEGTLGVYELNRVDLLRDVYTWAYERSCRRFTVLRDTLPQPDPIRLRWRAEVYECVSDVVRAGNPIEEAAVRSALSALVDAADVPTVLAIVLNELHTLHEGNIARFRVRPSEFRSWIAGLTPDRKQARS
jgi:Fic family protein